MLVVAIWFYALVAASSLFVTVVVVQGVRRSLSAARSRRPVQARATVLTARSREVVASGARAA